MDAHCGVVIEIVKRKKTSSEKEDDMKHLLELEQRVRELDSEMSFFDRIFASVMLLRY